MSVTPERLRNPGPTWGFRFLRSFQRAPRVVTRPLLQLGTWVAVAAMPEQRGHARAFLSRVYDRKATLREVWQNFFAYLEFLLLRLRVADGVPAACALTKESAADFEQLMASGEPALFGTFHFGHSDLLGFLLAARGRRVAMVRLRVGNSEDIAMFERQFGGAVTFIWVNEPEHLLFAIKDAIERGDSLAMQCDRLYSSKAEPFHFLGAVRLFPFTIYHLAVMFERPVAFCFGVPDDGGGTWVEAAAVFRPEPGLSRDANLERGRRHFQGVLTRLETLVRQDPTLWFNFLPLNPEVSNATPS